MTDKFFDVRKVGWMRWSRLVFALTMGGLGLVGGAKAAESAPASLVGYVVFVDQTVSGRGLGVATVDDTHVYFSTGPRREPYLYERLSSAVFRVTSFDPDHPTVAWSHLLFAFTNAVGGTMIDEDAGRLAGTFELRPPSPSRLSVVSQGGGVAVSVRSALGQLTILEESTALQVWTPVATNVLWTGEWTVLRSPSAGPGAVFYRAYVPTR